MAPAIWRRFDRSTGSCALAALRGRKRRQDPAGDASLDFIFSSHVLEHLANPLGHLAYWAKLLRKGGRTIAVIPDREGCKDFVFEDSTIDELEGELAAGMMDVQLRHYERWARHRMPGHSPEEIMRSGRSIHVHFYTPASMARVLGKHYLRLGYSDCRVVWSENHKDFFVILEK